MRTDAVAETEAGLIRPAASKEDLRQAATLLSVSGVRDLARVQSEEPGSVRLLVRDGEAVGALAFRPEVWHIGRAELRVARVWEVSGESGERPFRKTGDRTVFDGLVAEWCEYLQGAGYHLAYAHGALCLWPVHGFYPSFFHPRVYVPTSKALKLKEHYRVRGVKSSDAKPMRLLLEKHRHLRPRVFATGVPQFHHFAVEGPGRRVFGYFSMQVTDEPGQPPVFIPEVAVLNRAAVETILAHAAPFARERDMKALHFPLAVEHPFASACLDFGGYFQLRGSTRDITLDEEMVRIVDIEALLSCLADELAERLDLAEFSEMPRSFDLDVEGDKVGVRRSGWRLQVTRSGESELTVRMPRWAFTQLVMGYRSVLDLREGTVRPESALELVDSLFPKSCPLSLCDHDLWDSTLRDPDRYSPAAMREIRRLRYAF